MDRKSAILGHGSEATGQVLSEATLLGEIQAREVLLEPLSATVFQSGLESWAYQAGHIMGSLAWNAYTKNMENAQLRHNARHDDMTGLKNGVALGARLQDLINDNKAFGLAFLDINDFKIYNDTMGHAAGNQLLIKLGQHLSAAYKREDDTVVARLHGDEMGIIFLLGDNNERTPDLVEGFAKAKQYLLKTLEAFEEETGVSVAAGVIPYDPSNPCEPEELLDLSDRAMYIAKAIEKSNE